MILLRNLKNPILRKSILLQSLAITSPYTVISKDSKNILRGLTIQKLVKLSSNRNCNKAQDVIFCNMILETFIHNNVVNQMEFNSMENQVTRLINNSLAYIHQLSLLETLLLANNCLQLIKIKRINMNAQVLDKFLVKINNNIQNLIRKVKDGKYMHEIVKYTQFLVINKKFPEFTKNFINHIITQPKNQKQVIEILLVLLNFRYKNNLFIAQSVKKVLEQEISEKIIDQPLQSPLFDITILKIFLQLKLHINPPYSCIPKWLFILVQKLQIKYFTNEYNVSVNKKIQFLEWYTKFLLEVSLMSQSTCLSSRDYQCLTLSITKICEQLDFIDGDIYQTIMQFVSSLNNYLNFVRKYPVYYNNPEKQIEQTMLKIFYRYFTQINFSNISAHQQQIILKSLSKYLSILAEFDTQQSDRSSPLTQAEIYKIFNKTVEIFNHQLLKYSSQSSKYNYIFILLDQIGLLYQKLIQFQAKGHISIATNSITNIINTLDIFFTKISFQTVDQMYKQKRIIDFITISYIFVIKNVGNNDKKQELIPKSLSKLFYHLKKQNLSSVVETFIYLKQKNNLDIKEQILKLCQEIKSRTQSIQFKQPSEKQWIQQKNLGSSYTYKSQQEQIVANLINVVRCIENQQLSQVFKFWFIDNSQIIYNFWFSQKNPFVFNISWNYFIKCIRYLYSISYSCGIDFISDLMRVGHRQKSLPTSAVNKFIQIFDDRSVNISLSKKVDEFTIFKYAWLITLLTQYKTQSKNPTLQSQLKIRKKSLKPNQSTPYIQKQDIQQSQLQNQLQYQIDLLQFQKLKQQISLIIYDIKQPLQIQPRSFKSTYLCKIINWCMTNLVGHIKQLQINYKKENKQVQDNFIKRKQKLFSDIPMQQIIYFLSINNVLDKAYWLQQVSIDYLISFLQKKYSKTCQYNMLLAFPTQKLQTKKAHQILLSKQLQNYQKITKEKQKTNIPYPSVLKYYYHLLGPDSNEQKIKQNIEMIINKIVFTDRQIVEYWINKNIVLRTVRQQLRQAMLQRLFQIKYRYADDIEITYSQYTLILNTIITLFQRNSISNYKLVGNKQNQLLVGWVHGYLQTKITNINNQVYLCDYITITQYFGIKGLQYPVDVFLSKQLEKNRISILDILYHNKFILNQHNIDKFKSLVKRALDRSLGEDYYSLDFSTQFRIDVFFIRVFGIVLMQNNQQLLHWFNYEVLNRVNIQNLQQYLYKQQNSQKLYKIGMYMKLNDKLMSKQIEKPIQNLLKRIGTHQQKRIQQQISLQQTKRAQKLSKQVYSITHIKQTELNLYRKQNTEDLVYLAGGIELTAEELLEIQYIKIFLRNISKIKIIFFI